MENVYKRTGILFKILPCIFLVIFIGMICCSSCFASNYTINFEENNVIFPTDFNIDETPYWVLYKYKNGPDDAKVGLVYSSKPFYSWNANNSLIAFKDDGSVEVRYFVLSSSVNDYDFSSLSPSKATGWASSVKEILSSNHDIYLCTRDSSNNFVIDDSSLVFQAPPQVEEAVIAKQIQPEEMNKTLQEIVGILPIVMIVVVSYLALRKALKMLSTSLRNS